MIAARLGFVMLVAAGLAACAPGRVDEARLVLADIDAGDRPSALKRATPAPRRAAVAYRVDGRDHAGDLYRPGEPAAAALVLVPGVSETGKDDPRLIAFATTLARARFVVLVPDIAGLRALQVSAADARDIADAIAYVADRAGEDGVIGVAGISYAVGPAVIAALEPDVRDRVDFVLGIGGYHDIVAVVTFFTTGNYRARADAPWRWRRPNEYGKWVFVLSNARHLETVDDRRALEAMARRKLRDLDADVADLAARLGPEGRSFYALLVNHDPDRVPALIDDLPESVRAQIAALDLARRDLTRLSARLILVHGGEDGIIPPTESRALAAAAGEADVYVIDGLDHVDPRPGLVGKLQLWRAVHRLLEARDAAI